MKDLSGAKKILGLVSALYDAHFILSVALAPQSEEEEHSMSHVPYSNAVGSIMCAMVCTRSDISHAISVVSPVKVHWQAVK